MALLIAAVSLAVKVSGLALPLALGAGVVVAFVAWALPWLGVRWLDGVVALVRRWYWAPDEGRFHAFGGVPLEIHDDGLHVWLEADGLQRVLGRREPEQALAARHSGRWQRREGDGALLLRVDAVVEHLATMPGRDAPRLQRLRRYLERDVLFPAAERRRRAGR